MKSDFIWMDGELIPYDQAKVHVVTTPTLHYGVGVFEGIRCYDTPNGPGIFRLGDHLRRFLESIHILGIRDLAFTLGDLRQGVFQVMRVNGFRECYIRPLMFLDGPLGMNMDLSRPRVAIACWEWGPSLGEALMETGIHMMVASFVRPHPNNNMTKSKVAGNYVNSLLVKTLALRSGYDEAVILDPNGFVGECTGENIFMVRDGVLSTPPVTTVLAGITRDCVLTLARDLGIQCEECMITRDQLYIADEVFITGTAAELVGVRMIDFRQIGAGQVGPITLALTQAFQQAVHGENEHFTKWLDYGQGVTF
jgi:branched-chain amino acid aminotransferase